MARGALNDNSVIGTALEAKASVSFHLGAVGTKNPHFSLILCVPHSGVVNQNALIEALFEKWECARVAVSMNTPCLLNFPSCGIFLGDVIRAKDNSALGKGATQPCQLHLCCVIRELSNENTIMRSRVR